MSEERSAERLFNAFFGKPGAAHQPPPPPGDIPPLEEMLKALVGIGERTFGRYAFSRDPLRGKFPAEEKDRLTVLANRCGREYAAKLAERYHTDRPEELAKALGMQVDYPMQPTGVTYVTFARFTPPDKISIYRHSLDKANDLLAQEPVGKVMGNLAVQQVLLAHELFHVVEERNKKEIFTRTEKVKLWAPWPLRNRSTIRCLGEIAGMAFAGELTGLAYSPFVLDVFLIYGYSQAAAFKLYQELMELDESLHAPPHDTGEEAPD